MRMNHFRYHVSEKLIRTISDKTTVSILSSRLIKQNYESFQSYKQTTDDSICFIQDGNSLSIDKSKLKGLVIVGQSQQGQINDLPDTVSYIVVSDPKYFFASLFYSLSSNNSESILPRYSPASHPLVHPSTIVSEGAKIGVNVSIGRNCFISDGVNIHDSVRIGNSVFIKQNSVIGGIGFGYALKTGMPPLRMPHFGGVLIGNNVDIGSSANIDRGTFGDTNISDDVKIDNAVHIAHNVFIGERSLIIANAEISGTVHIGSDVWIAPNVSIREKVVIGDRAFVGIGSVVTKNVDSDTTVFGAPAKPSQK